MRTNHEASLSREQALFTRRALLQRAGWLMTAAALPSGMTKAAQDASPASQQAVSPVMAELSAYMS